MSQAAKIIPNDGLGRRDRWQPDMRLAEQAGLGRAKSLCSKISGPSMVPGTSFRRRPQSSVFYPSTRGRHLRSGFRQSDKFVGRRPINAFETGSKKGLKKNF